MINSLLWASLGTLGFGLVFNANKNKLLYILIGGFLNYLTYALIYKLTSNIFYSSLFSACITYLYSSLMARVTKSPAIIYILTGLIPIVPGGALFYTMQNFVLGNENLAIKYASIAAQVILGTASGIALFSVTINLIKDLKHNFNH